MSCECHKGSDAYEAGLATLSRRVSVRDSQRKVCNTDSEKPCIIHDIDSKRLRDLMFVRVCDIIAPKSRAYVCLQSRKLEDRSIHFQST